MHNFKISTCVTRTSLENCDDSMETPVSFTGTSPAERNYNLTALFLQIQTGNYFLTGKKNQKTTEAQIASLLYK